jgi:SanA protein
MPRKSTSPSFFRRFGRRLIWTGGILLALATTLVAVANYRILSANRDRLHSNLGAVPACEVALVLGTSPKFQNGRTNLHFEGRMDAAAELYRAGKVKHLLVSGDNRHRSYNEPVEMRAALIKRGVPAAAVTLDFAGFRTLDSVVRARQVFGLDRCIIVTQRYHNPRALEIARANNLDAWGYCPPDVAFAHSFRTECREVLARTVTLLDLYVWHREPRFLGKPEPIRLASH